MTKTVFTIAPPPGQTRLCLDPWAKAFVRADGKVCLCCNAPPVGSLSENTLDEVLDGDEATKYRRGLLNGELMPACQTCPDKQTTTVVELKQNVQQFLLTGEMSVY